MTVGYNTNRLLKDAEGNPIPQVYDPETDSFKPATKTQDVSDSNVLKELKKLNENNGIALQAYDKSVDALGKSEAAETNSVTAVETANDAKTTSESVKNQFDQVVAEAGSNNPEVVQARGGEVNLNARFEKVNALMAQIAYISIKSYEHLTKVINGVTDWTDAFQQAFNDLPNNGTLTIPNETFHCDKATLSNKKNVTIKNLGVISPIPNKTAMFGVFNLVNLENCTFEGLCFEGISSQLIYNGIGMDCVIAMDRLKNCTFNNTIINDTIMSAICSNGGCENIYFNNLVANDIGEHLIYLSGYGNNNVFLNDFVVNNIGVNPQNEIDSKMNAVVKGRVTWEKGQTELHGKVTLNNVTYTQSNPIYQQVLLWAYDTKEFECNNVKVIGDNVSFALLGNYVEKIRINNSIIHKKLFYNVVNDKTNLTDVKVFNTDFLNFNGFYNFVSEYNNCFFDFTGDNLYDHNPIGVPTPQIVSFNNCEFITDNKRFKATNLISKNIVFSKCTFDRHDNTSQVPFEFFSIGESSTNENNYVSLNDCEFNANYIVNLRFYKRCVSEINNTKLNYGRLQSETDIILKMIKVFNSELSTPKVDSNLKSDRFHLNGVYGKNTFDATKIDRFDEGSKSYTSVTGNTSVNVDLRYAVAKNLTVNDLIVSNNKGIPFSITTSTTNMFTISYSSQPSETIFNVRWKN